MAIQLTIVTPAQIAFQGSADQVQAPGCVGEFGVLPGHASLLTLTVPGIVTIHSGGSQTRLLVGKGVAEAGPDRLTLLVDLCEKPDTIDKAAAQAALSKAQAEFAASIPDTLARSLAEGHIALAQARLRA